MNIQLPQNKVIVRETKSRKQCFEFHLVLQAAHVPAEVVFADEDWLLVVNAEQEHAARAELDAYAHEHRTAATDFVQESPNYPGTLVGVCVYVGINVVIGVWAAQSFFGFDWLPAGDMRAGAVMAGEWWRVFTALTLHADVGHLAANLVFGTLFGWLAGQALGGGMAWLTILLGGALGNAANAVFQSSQHVSIGASTAVFSALGVLVAHRLKTGSTSSASALRRWSPLIGGVVLLALLGVGGPDTDVMAHCTGFVAGVPAGWIACKVPHRWLASPNFQKILGAAAMLILCTAWAVALTNIE